MIQISAEVNTPTLLTLQSLSQSTGQPVPTDLTFIKDGVLVSNPTVTFTDVGTKGLYNFAFTLIETGTWIVYAYGAMQAQIEVVSRTLISYLQNIEDESLGSWVWDKVAGTLHMLGQTGTPLASFTVVDNLTTASRERTV